VRPILFLARAEVLHVVRDRATLAQCLIVPIVQLLVLSNAATFQIRNTPTYVVDLDRSTTSRGLVARFAASGHFRVAGDSASLDRANDALLRGDVTMVLAIPRDFEASLVRTSAAPVELSVNAEKGSAAGIVQAYASAIVSAYAAELDTTRAVAVERERTTEREPFRRASIDVRTRSWYNPALNYRDYMVPGILVALVTLIGTLLTAQNIAREKELGTLEQLNVTPLRRWELIVGKLLPYGVIAFVDVLLVTAVAVFWFEVPFRGSLTLLLATSLLYVICTLGLGLFISTVSDTQQQAMMTATFFFLTPMIYLSGFIFPIENMPRVIQYATYLIPLRYFLVIVRGIFLKGIGLDLLWPQAAALAAWGFVVLALAVARSRKRMA